MKEKVEGYFLNHNKFVSIGDLKKYLGLKTDDLGELIDILYELETAGKIIGDDDSKYMRVPIDYIYKLGVVQTSSKTSKYIKMDRGKIAIISGDTSKLKDGDKVYYEVTSSNKHKSLFNAHIVRVIKRIEDKTNYVTKAIIDKDFNKGMFFITIDKDRIYIPDKYINGASIFDEVSVRIRGDKNSKYGVVEDIIKRKNNYSIFVAVDENGVLKAKPVFTVGKKILIKDSNINPGDLLLYRIEKNSYVFDRVLHDVDDDLKLYAMEFGFDVDFQPATIDEAEKISNVINNEEEKRRVDLTNLETFTIDSEYSKDLDDAVSLEKDGDNYVLYVSIADVSYYVKPGSALFEEARKRTTSVYPANTVIPMLPTKLSNGVCSLNEGEKRLAKTVKMVVNSSGDVIDFNIFDSIIKSNKKMSYKKVNDILENKKQYPDYESFVDTLTKMNELSKILSEKRIKRGCIDFNVDEYVYEFDDDNKVSDVYPRKRGLSELLIENFMLLTNEIVASFILNLDNFCAFRNHEAPSLDELYKMKKRLVGLSKYLKTLDNAVNPKVLQQILTNICKNKNEEESKVISKIMLSSMQRAFYSTYCVGHYGLALNEYATFTSPIRRFPDLLNHIVIEALITGNYEVLEKCQKDYESMCLQANEKKLCADKLESCIDGLLMKEFLTELDGEEIPAKVTFVDNNGAYIRTEAGGINGIILSKKGEKIVDNMIYLKGTKIGIGDEIIVRIKDSQRGIMEPLFSFVKLKSKKVKKLEKNRRCKND